MTQQNSTTYLFTLALFLSLCGLACEKKSNDCPAGLTGSNCDETLLPKRVGVKSVKVLQYPALRANGQPWDELESGTGQNPDLNIWIQRSLNVPVKGSNISRDNDFASNPMPNIGFENIFSPNQYRFEGDLDDLFVVSLIDSDDNFLPPTFDFMGSQTFRFYEPGQPFPAKITLPATSPGGVGFELELIPEF